MCRGFYDNMRPQRTLVVREPGAEARGFAPHFDWYPGAPVTSFDPKRGELDETVVREFLDGLDVLYTAETFYDHRIPDWCAQAGVVPVVHQMPEFRRDWPPNVVVWAPTSWRMDLHPPGAPVVPVPVDTRRIRFAPTPFTDDGPLRLLHVVGKRAASDRNGTLTFNEAMRWVVAPIHVTYTCQDRSFPNPSRLPRYVTAELRRPPNYWDAYPGHHALVLPRRYGGLSLPVQEALAAGLAVVLPDVSPNTDWPAVRVPARFRGRLRCAAGMLPLAEVDPRALAGVVDGLPERLPGLVAAGREWVAEHSWDALAPLYEAMLTVVVERSGWAAV